MKIDILQFCQMHFTKLSIRFHNFVNSISQFCQFDFTILLNLNSIIVLIKVLIKVLLLLHIRKTPRGSGRRNGKAPTRKTNRPEVKTKTIY